MLFLTHAQTKNNSGIAILVLKMKKRILLYLGIAVLPFLIVILVNESTKTEPSHRVKMVLPGTSYADALNSDKRIPEYCTWDCHNNGCSHALDGKNKINKGTIKLLYFAIIDANGVHDKQEGKYIRITLLTLVVLWPLLMFGLIIGNVELYRRRKNGNPH